VSTTHGSGYLRMTFEVELDDSDIHMLALASMVKGVEGPVERDEDDPMSVLVYGEKEPLVDFAEWFVGRGWESPDFNITPNATEDQ